MKKLLLIFCIACLTLFSCQKDDAAVKLDEDNIKQPKDSIADPNPDSDPQPDPQPNPDPNVFTDTFDGNGNLIDYVTNKASALPETARVDGRYRAELTNNEIT